MLRLLGQIVHHPDRPAEWAVVDLTTPGARGQQKYVAQELGITAQAVSRAVVRSHWLEEWATRPAAARLLDLTHGPATLPEASLAYRRRKPALQHGWPAGGAPGRRPGGTGP